MLSNQFFALFPQCLCGFAIECVRADAFAANAQRPVFRNDLADVAVLAILSADLFSGRNKASPDRGGRSLRDRLVLEGLPARCRGLLIQSIDLRLQLSRVEMPGKFGLDASGMDRRGSDPAVAMP